MKGKEKMDAWSQMFQGEKMCPVDAKVEEAVRARNAENWKRTHEMVVQELDESIQRTEVEEAVGKMKSGKAPGEDRITAELLKGVKGKRVTALWFMFKKRRKF